MSRLDDAIENLYEAFADVPQPRTIDACPCCFTQEEIIELLASCRRNIAPKLLGSYAANALLTVGSVDDYLYYLPRILELAIDDSWWPDPEITGRAIHSTEPHKWPFQRRQALEEYLSAVVHSLLAPGRQHQLDSRLCAIARIGMDVRPHLHAIEQSTDAVLEYFTDNASDLPHRRLTNAFWERPNDGHDAIVAWFYSPRIRKIVFDAYGYVLPSDSRSATAG